MRKCKMLFSQVGNTTRNILIGINVKPKFSYIEQVYNITNLE